MPQWIPYCGAAPLPAEWMARWNFDPLLLAALTALAFAYMRMAKPANAYERAGFWFGFALLIIIFVSPFCALSSALFSVRVAHHLLLATVVAPLFVLSAPKLRVRGSLAFWTAAQALVFWLWHAPPAYAAALSSDIVYWLLQLALLASAVAFWDGIRRAAPAAAVIALLASLVQMGLLGAIITFAPQPLYAPHFLTTSAWGFSPLGDQQLAGLLMWVPAAGIYLAAALLVMARMLKPAAHPPASAWKPT